MGKTMEKRLKIWMMCVLAVAVAVAQPSFAQTKKKTPAKSASVQRKQPAKASAKKPAAKKAVQKKPATQQKKPANTKQTNAKNAKAKPKTETYTTPNIKKLQGQRQEIQKKIRQQEQALKANQADVKQRLRNLMALKTAINERQLNIDNIQKDINSLDGDIDILKAQLSTLEEQLTERKLKFVKSMQYISRHRNSTNSLMFIFSADNFAQMFRRMRFVRQYGAYQKAQGEVVKAKQEQVEEKKQQLEELKGRKNALLAQGQKERVALQGQQQEQQDMVNSLQKQQRTIQGIITQQRKQDEELNRQIDKLIAIEVEKARKKAEEEARQKAAAEAAAKKKREEELARKKAAAEAAARENARRIAEAKEREAKAKEEAKAAAQLADAKEKERANQRAREAEANRVAVERKAKADAERSQKELETAKASVEEPVAMTAADRMMSGGLERNKGRLPMPITGSYRIVSRFGVNSVEGLRGVYLDNKGINIKGADGCQARCIYDGEVRAVSQYGGLWVIIVKHGSYYSVYCNIRTPSVFAGGKVRTRQTLGTVGPDNILHFQLHKGASKLNPETWLGR